jgi:hypothetical protein
MFGKLLVTFPIMRADFSLFFTSKNYIYMSLSEIILYLKVFGLIVFDLFFLFLIVFGIYGVFVFFALKKRLLVLMDSVQTLVDTVTNETESISSEIVQKVQSINLNKVALTSGLGSSLFLIGKSLFRRKKSTSTFADILRFWFK